jgi:hypothetical protein
MRRVLSSVRGAFALMLLLIASSCARGGANGFSSMIDHAVQIQESLAADKMDGVSPNASSIATEAQALGKPGETIAAGAMELQKAKTIDQARTAFAPMSEALVSYLEAQKQTPGNDVRVAYCPMIRKPWLQKDGAIRNPYYGASMLTCGSFKP